MCVLLLPGDGSFCFYKQKDKKDNDYFVCQCGTFSIKIVKADDSKLCRIHFIPLRLSDILIWYLKLKF
jgi:hypothetical protein